MKFKKGQKVRIIKANHPLKHWIGQIGEIIRWDKDNEWYEVDFPNHKYWDLFFPEEIRTCEIEKINKILGIKDE